MNKQISREPYLLYLFYILVRFRYSLLTNISFHYFIIPGQSLQEAYRMEMGNIVQVEREGSHLGR